MSPYIAQTSCKQYQYLSNYILIISLVSILNILSTSLHQKTATVSIPMYLLGIHTVRIASQQYNTLYFNLCLTWPQLQLHYTSSSKQEIQPEALCTSHNQVTVPEDVWYKISPENME